MDIYAKYRNESFTTLNGVFFRKILEKNLVLLYWMVSCVWVKSLDEIMLLLFEFSNIYGIRIMAAVI